MSYSFRRRFGLMMAGSGARVAAIAMATGTLDLAQVVASTILVPASIVLYIIS